MNPELNLNQLTALNPFAPFFMVSACICMPLYLFFSAIS